MPDRNAPRAKVRSAERCATGPGSGIGTFSARAGAVLALHIGLVASLVLIPLFIGALLLRVRAVLSARERTRGAARQLEQRYGAEQGSRLVRGVLRVGGALPHGGGATSLWSSTSRLTHRDLFSRGRARARELSLQTTEGKVVLEGEVEVLSGSTARFDGSRYPGATRRAFSVVHTVRDGDLVTVLGAPKEAGCPPGSMKLGPTGDGDALALAAARSRVQVSFGGYVRHAAMVPLLIVGLVPLYTLADDLEELDCAASCSRTGDCSVGSTLVTRGFVGAARAAIDGRHLECVAALEQSCRISTDCTNFGLCSRVRGHCTAIEREDCLGTQACVDLGACSPKDGFCQVLETGDCRHLATCTELGHCLPRDGACRGVDDASCEASTLCRRSGRCHQSDGGCVAASDGDCRGSEECLTRGRCVSFNGACIGEDRERLGTGDRPKTDRECEDDPQCGWLRLCRASPSGHCESDAPTCAASRACTRWGNCVEDQQLWGCHAEAKSCAASELCAGKKDCRPRDGICTVSCAQTAECRNEGRCTDDRRDSCVAATDADCRGSAACKIRGRCTANRGWCEVGSDADCAGSAECRGSGACTKVFRSCERSQRDCASTPGCRLRGECALESGRCVVESDRDCEKSELCARNGWCRASVRPHLAHRVCGP